MISQRVRGVIAAFKLSGRNLKPLFCEHSTGTGTPPQSRT